MTYFAGLIAIPNPCPISDRTDRVPPPMSAATGGLMTGIDLNDIAASQEIEDLDYARRFK